MARLAQCPSRSDNEPLQPNTRAQNHELDNLASSAKSTTGDYKDNTKGFVLKSQSTTTLVRKMRRIKDSHAPPPTLAYGMHEDGFKAQSLLPSTSLSPAKVRETCCIAHNSINHQTGLESSLSMIKRTTCLDDIKSDRESDRVMTPEYYSSCESPFNPIIRQPYSRGHFITRDKNDIRRNNSQESIRRDSYLDNSTKSATEDQGGGDVNDGEETSSVYQTAAEDLTTNEIDSDCTRDEPAQGLVDTHVSVFETDSGSNRSDSIHSHLESNDPSVEVRPQLKKPVGSYLPQNIFSDPNLEHHQGQGVMPTFQQKATPPQTESLGETESSTLSTGPQIRPLRLGKVAHELLERPYKMDEWAVSTSSLDSSEDAEANKDQIEIPFTTPRIKKANTLGLTLPCDLPGNLTKSYEPSALEPRDKVAPVKSSPSKKKTKSIFDNRKDTVAKDFLSELDAKITKGEIARLTQLTGGVKVIWTKSLNTTAGRANWRRETTQSRPADGTAKLEQRHHASIELAEKVINDESKLLNVVAHEFCHLANFMISGVNNRPHGVEFQAWAAKCSRAFGESHGIHVTTRHTYDIDFKYVWRCTTCGYEYKRHSRSIKPGRHGCGNCKGTLEQIKPVPRVAKGGATGSATGNPNQYQTFMKKHMKIVRSENPGSPQKDLMKMVAERWALDKKKAMTESMAKTGDETIGGVVDQMEQMTLNQ
ncbi:hypothetical protein CDD82_6383 [Ophiocordyceps australis]|uniref:SprT-like domain-containing protein n=1 Tax=Ophiocordyceps australis TaxID=1399860 RepID=A0A2C5Y0N6_9HYPO|nr:hypothetical protein CDD82_6383 [Ophiocordyceps australis]